MAQKRKRTTSGSKPFASPAGSLKVSVPKVDWLDPEIIRFQGDKEPPLDEGFQIHMASFQQPALWHPLIPGFGRTKDEVGAEWRKIVGQISAVLDTAAPTIKDFTLEEITFKLGFSAEGHIVFVAKAGVETTISATFKRKSANKGEAADHDDA